MKVRVGFVKKKFLKCGKFFSQNFKSKDYGEFLKIEIVLTS